MLLLVIGHSFVLWLEESPGHELRATVSVTFRDVMMKGIGRPTVDHMAVMLPIVKTLSPSVVLLIVGTYDLYPLVFIPERFACQIAELAVMMFRRVSSVEIRHHADSTTHLDMSPIDE